MTDIEQRYELPEGFEPPASRFYREQDNEQAYDWPDEAPLRPKFKDCAAHDIEAVFFCLDEFAEVHNIDGADMPVVMEADTVADRASHWEAGAKQNFDTGLYNAHLTLYVKARDYGKRPKVGKVLNFDNGLTQYRVLNWREDAGVYLMTVERIRM